MVGPRWAKRIKVRFAEDLETDLKAWDLAPCKVIVEEGASSGSGRSNTVTIIVLLVVALALVAYILLHMHH